MNFGRWSLLWRTVCSAGPLVPGKTRLTLQKHPNDAGSLLPVGDDSSLAQHRGLTNSV